METATAPLSTASDLRRTNTATSDRRTGELTEIQATPEQIEAAGWWEYHFAAKQRYEGKREQPFSEFATELFSGMAEKIQILAPLYEEAERIREVVLERYAQRVRGNITQSKQIPAFCRLPYPIDHLQPHGDVADVIQQAFEAGRNLYIAGPVGVGKTYVACQCVYLWCIRNLRFAIATSLYEEAVCGVAPQPVIENFHETLPIKQYPLFLAARDFLHELRQTFDGGGSETEVLKKYRNVPVLVFDDLGAEKITDWTRDRVFFLLEKRLYDKTKQTIITSNLRLNELATSIDDRLASRIVETCGVFRLDGDDRRMQRSVTR